MLMAHREVTDVEVVERMKKQMHKVTKTTLYFLVLTRLLQDDTFVELIMNTPINIISQDARNNKSRRVRQRYSKLLQDWISYISGTLLENSIVY